VAAAVTDYPDGPGATAAPEPPAAEPAPETVSRQTSNTPIEPT